MKTCSRSRWHRRILLATAIFLFMTGVMVLPGARAQVCAGDCNMNGMVTVDEIITMVNIALTQLPVSACTAGDSNSDGTITIDEILAGVNHALTGCTTTVACGNGVVDSGEDCDVGGTCVGGTNAGTSCMADGQCAGDGVCDGGPKTNWACSSNSDCPSGNCVHCKTFGGSTIPNDSTHTCAANCTFESEVNITLVPGRTENGGTSCGANSSCLGVYTGVGLTVAIPVPGVSRQLIVGKQKDGKIPVIMKAETNQTPGIEYTGGLACVCLRAVPLLTCGGTLWEKDGTPSTDCTPGYTAGNSLCAGTKPCTLVYGSDNAGAGSIGCNSLDGVDVARTQDSGGGSGTPGPILTTLSGTGGAGSAVIYLTTELGFILSPCSGTSAMYGADQTFCTDDDPQSARGSLLPQVLTTGNATAMVLNANGIDTNTVPDPPVTIQGATVSCTAIANGDASGGALADAFPDLNAAPQVQDIAVNITQVACPPAGTPGAPAGCP